MMVAAVSILTATEAARPPETAADASYVRTEVVIITTVVENAAPGRSFGSCTTEGPGIALVRQYNCRTIGSQLPENLRIPSNPPSR